LLKNLNPLLSGALLTTLDAMEPGQWITLAGSQYPTDRMKAPVIELGEVTTEEAATAILSVLPLENGSPIAFLDRTGTMDELPDVAFAVRGIAADAELRRVSLEQMQEEEFFALAENSIVTVHVGSEAPPAAFLFRKGE
jgi:L-fucose mutarotase